MGRTFAQAAIGCWNHGILGKVLAVVSGNGSDHVLSSVVIPPKLHRLIFNFATTPFFQEAVADIVLGSIERRLLTEREMVWHWSNHQKMPT